MPMDPLSKWSDTLGNLAPSSTPIWALNLANAVDGLCSGKAGIAGVTGTVKFTFNKPIFIVQLMAMAATPFQPIAAQGIAMAWQTAMLASIMVVAPGSYLGAPTPATTWSVVFSSLIDPPSVMAATSVMIATISAAQAVGVGSQSIMGPALFAGFSTSTVTVTGLNAVPSPAGPLPLVAPLLPLI
jgi:hypothetical protein